MSDQGEPWRPYVVGEDSPPPRQAPRALRHVWADEIVINFDDEGLIAGLAPRRGLTVLYGESNSGKTFWAILMASSIALGTAFYGMAVEQGVVVYVAAEAPESVKRRVLASRLHLDADHLPILVVEEALDLMTEDADALIALIHDKIGPDGRVAAIFVDTVATTMRGDENRGEDMGVYIGNLQRIGAAFNTHIVAIHHCGKDTARGARGWSGLRAATDVELECADCVVTVTKLRDGMRKGERFGFELVDVEIGQTSAGAAVKTAVAVALDQPPAKAPKPEHLSDRQKLVLQCLGTAMVDHGVIVPRAHDIPAGTRGVAYERWIEASARYLPDKAGNKQREAFKRCVEALQAKGLAKHVDGWCWPG